MANTTTVNGRFKQITGLDADWKWNSDLPTEFQLGGGIMIKAIQFHPSAQNDRMIIREGHIDGAAIADLY